MSCPGSPGPKAQVRALPREPSCPGRLLYTFCQDMALQVCWAFRYESLFLPSRAFRTRDDVSPGRLGLPEGRAVSPQTGAP